MRRRSAFIYRHSLVTRITHAAFSLAFLGLIVTGFQIYFHQHWLPLNVARVHQYCGLAMIAIGLIYLTAGLLSGSLKKLLFGPRDVAGLVPMAAYYLHLRKDAPVYPDYNPLQKIAYTLIILTLGPMMAATGLALWPHLAVFRPLARFFGGRNDVAIWHAGFGLELVLFFAGHMFMVATTGLRNNIRAIVTGWYRLPATESAAPSISEIAA